MIPSKQSIIQAHERIKPFVHRTPILTSKNIDQLTGCKIFFKCENFQKIGAFKARGAMNAALLLNDTERANGLATHSSGNHAQAVARAAVIMNVKSFIVMPHSASEIKKKGVRALHGEIYECHPSLQAREEKLAEVIKKTGAVEIHPFNNYGVIEGQATVAKEIFEEIPDVDILLAPVGGGGLLSGTALATNYFSTRTIVIGAEPEGADDAFRAMHSGKIELSQGRSVADGLLTSLGTKTFPIIKEHVKEVITVSDQEIISAMRLIWERLKIIVEPSGAVPLAAVMKQPEKFSGKSVAVILTGGNIDLTTIGEFFS